VASAWRQNSSEVVSMTGVGGGRRARPQAAAQAAVTSPRLRPSIQGRFARSAAGGAKRNIESEVIAHDGRAIPRLYEAGELGSMFSNLYQNGSYLTECMISGRAAGRNGARQPAWPGPAA